MTTPYKPAWIVGLECPHCSAAHLLAPLGTKPIVQDLSAPALDPSLHTPDNGTSWPRAQCAECGGLFWIRLRVTAIREKARLRVVVDETEDVP